MHMDFEFMANIYLRKECLVVRFLFYGYRRKHLKNSLNIMQIQNNVLWDIKHFTKCSSHSDEYLWNTTSPT